MFWTFYIYFPDFLVISEGFLTDLKFLKIFFYFNYLSINIHLIIKIYQSIYLFISLSIYLPSIYLSILSIYLSFYISF